MNIDVPVSDALCIVVIANGLHLWHGAQFIFDATILSPVSRAGAPTPALAQQCRPTLAASGSGTNRTPSSELASVRRARFVVVAETPVRISMSSSFAGCACHSRLCTCRRPLDVLGDHRAACATAGVLALRAIPLERTLARVCREAGARVAKNVRLADMNLDVPVCPGYTPQTTAKFLLYPVLGRARHCRLVVFGTPGEECSAGGPEPAPARAPLLLLFCAAPHDQHLLRTVPPAAIAA